jgi:hypothetical protein
MSEEQQKALIEQIRSMYEEWAAEGPNTEHFARLTNGLFELAKEIDADAMMSAFFDGIARSRGTAR